MPRLVLFAGLIEPYKGLADLIAAFGRLAARRPHDPAVRRRQAERAVRRRTRGSSHALGLRGRTVLDLRFLPGVAARRLPLRRRRRGAAVPCHHVQRTAVRGTPLRPGGRRDRRRRPRRGRGGRREWAAGAAVRPGRPRRRHRAAAGGPRPGRGSARPVSARRLVPKAGPRPPDARWRSTAASYKAHRLPLSRTRERGSEREGSCWRGGRRRTFLGGATRTPFVVAAPIR